MTPGDLKAGGDGDVRVAVGAGSLSRSTEQAPSSLLITRRRRRREEEEKGRG